jgi:hypothetical protein
MNIDDITSAEQAKALAYDVIVQIENSQNILRLLNNKIAEFNKAQNDEDSAQKSKK